MQPQSTNANRQLLAITILTAVITLGWVVAVLISKGGDPLSFVLSGTRFTQHDPNGSTGYDGQFAYYIATKGFGATPYLDVPAYRYQRILYPLVAGVLGLGQSTLVAWALIALNIAALVAATRLLAGWLIRCRTSPWYALVFATWVGCLFAVRLDLNELLCMTLSLAGLLLIADGRTRLGIVALALGALTKDMAFVFIGAAGLYLWSRNRRLAVITVGLSALPYVLWGLYLQLTLGGLKTSGAPPIAMLPIIPFSGYLHAKTSIELLLMVLWLIIPALILGGWSIRCLLNGDASLPVCLALMAALWVAYLPGLSAYDLVAAYRVAMPIIPAGLLFAAQIRQRRLLLGLSALWFPALLQVLLLPGFFF